jgi:hypothetical protein
VQTTDPPYVPIRHVRWPARRTPRWLIAGIGAVLAVGVLVGLAVHPSRSQRAADMNGFLRDMTTEVGSCAAGLGDSLTVLHAIESGASQDVNTAVSVAAYGAKNCSPANSMPMDDLTTYQVQESLFSFHLDRAVNGLLTWAFPDAQRVMNDIVTTVRATGPARTAATAKLQHDLHILNTQRTYVTNIMLAAVHATGATEKLPVLPG